ncbi:MULTISPECIES: ribonucleoside-triphosphate reductase, adenosylcobalamin-dependent [Streptomyces]|uniref:ribonucleoside-triphosphate reductase, adenosylcobalamin-dependent n=1 Tax=Streptomyces TaxID=1883 RepID=UPI001E2E71DD|nr:MULTISPECIES: ribonucleoside-triphosphate reductase, adenosylcobalamin-dependent [Streptomyces]UFQ16388.1 ribonucleoside-triphosphate reductase, adenosylcobalamin-dependent [Streptomyces huasconensis]WCL85991.1 ribonucleoside-triphosphate reductase, adenosylcobalamin-dependent [Streptomyces sp. JCM 35825]
MTFPTDTAKTVYERTYSRRKPTGEHETWPETVRRVVDGNLALVEPRYIAEGERDRLIELMETFKILPAGRHLKSSGVSDYALNNCWAAGWDHTRPEKHFTFVLLRLAEGGGVGSNYSNRYLADFPTVASPVTVHIVCDPEHQDHDELKAAGLLSETYSHEWAGAYAVEDSRQGWAAALGDLIKTAHDPDTRHEHRVYDVSRVRPKGAPLKSFGGTASGPAPFAELLVNTGKVLFDAVGRPLTGRDAMLIDHETARCIVSGGVRRSARMSIMAWDDPQIEWFLQCKADSEQSMWTTNISVEVDGRFFELLHKMSSPSYPILRKIAEGARTTGEPGFWNSAKTAEGEVDGTFTVNPCGEATLTAWEPCCLGNINLGAYVDRSGIVDWDGLHEAHYLMTRYLIRATMAPVADKRSEEAIRRYHRIGVGHLAFADFLAKQGILYTEAPEDRLIQAALKNLAGVVDKAADEYSNELRIPRPIKTRVIAPTGTTSKLAGASGEGIHAPFATYFLRRIRFSMVEPSEVAQVEEYRRKGYKVEPCIYAANTAVVEIPTKDPLLDEVLDPSYVQHAGQLSLRDMLAVQRLYQECWADQAVSYTASIDPQRYSTEDVETVLREFMGDLKGSTLFPEFSRGQAPYERLTREEYEAAVEALGIETADTSYDEICASGACPV